MKAYIPANLDLSAVLRDNPPNFKYHIDEFYYIIDLITSIPAKNKSILEKYNYVLINSKILKKTINSYKKYLSYLLQCNILETDNKYITFEKSKGYRFTTQYQGALTTVELKKYTIVKNVQRRKLARTKSYTRKYRHLSKWLNDSL